MVLQCICEDLLMKVHKSICWLILLLSGFLVLAFGNHVSFPLATAATPLPAQPNTDYPVTNQPQITVASNHTSYLPLITVPEPANTFYISPTGNDAASGRSPAQAWATFNRAWQDIYPGDTLILLDGIYYQRLNPNRRNGEPGNPITIKALNDGQAIIDGQYQRVPVKLGNTWPGPIGDYFVIEGIVARNSNDYVIVIDGGQHNVLRRVSAYNANTDTNSHVIGIIWPSAQHNLIEDCVAAGTGRKMIMTYQSSNNTIRRCFTYWQEWDGRDFCGVHWPNGQSIQVYHGNDNILENNIAIGPVPQSSISVQANDPRASAIGNQVLGSIAINAGMNANGTVKQWGDVRPQPTSCTGMTNFNWPNNRSGFSLHGSGILRDNLFQDIFSWGHAGLGLVEGMTGTLNNNQIVRATVVNNGINNPCGPWYCQWGGVDTDALQASLNKFNTIQNSYIEQIFINWPEGGVRNMTSMSGEGARLTHRYSDGVLTSEPLWPWPMEARIQAEMGISVTDLIGGIISGLSQHTAAAPTVTDSR
jgi:hypothetical protein